MKIEFVLGREIYEQNQPPSWKSWICPKENDTFGKPIVLPWLTCFRVMPIENQHLCSRRQVGPSPPRSKSNLCWKFLLTWTSSLPQGTVTWSFHFWSMTDSLLGDCLASLGEPVPCTRWLSRGSWQLNGTCLCPCEGNKSVTINCKKIIYFKLVGTQSSSGRSTVRFWGGTKHDSLGKEDKIIEMIHKRIS